MNGILEKGTSFVWENARSLERAVFDYHFSGGSPGRIPAILHTYQNEDGGFGHALEPDVRASESQPLFVEFALRTLHDCGLRDPSIATRACDFLSRHANLTSGIPLLFPSARQYPRASHMRHPSVEERSFDRLIGLVGLVSWQGIHHPWLEEAVDACLARITAVKFDDAHTILTAFTLVESLSQQRPIDQLFDKLAEDLMHASWFSLDAPVKSYSLTPLTFAPSPASFCRRIFTQSQLDAHLDDLQAQQQEDGGWPILWEPPGPMARCEWRAQKTVEALLTLREYGRI